MNLKNVFSPVDAMLAMMGQHNGVTTINDTALIQEKFYMIQTITDTVFALLNEQNHTGGAITGVTVKAGIALMGEFTEVKLTSGIVRAYRV